MSDENEEYVSDPAGDASEPGLARPYALTEGRTRPTLDLPVEAQVESLPEGQATRGWPDGDPRHDIVEVCQKPTSIAEIGAFLKLPLGVVRVLVADLVSADAVRIRDTLDGRATSTERRDLIERTLRGLHALR